MSDRFHQMKTAIEEGRELGDFTSSDLIHQIEKVDAIRKRVVNRLEWVSASVWAVGTLATAVGAGTLVVVLVLPLAKYASVPFFIVGAVFLTLAAYALSWLRRAYKGWETTRDLCVANRALLGEKLVAAGEAERAKERADREAEEARGSKERAEREAEREAEEKKRREEQEAAEAKERETARAAAEARVARERKAAETRAAVRPLWEKFRDGERGTMPSAPHGAMRRAVGFPTRKSGAGLRQAPRVCAWMWLPTLSLHPLRCPSIKTRRSRSAWNATRISGAVRDDAHARPRVGEALRAPRCDGQGTLTPTTAVAENRSDVGGESAPRSQRASTPNVTMPMVANTSTPGPTPSVVFNAKTDDCTPAHCVPAQSMLVARRPNVK